MKKIFLLPNKTRFKMADLPGTAFPKYCSLLFKLFCSHLLFSSLVLSFLYPALFLPLLTALLILPLLLLMCLSFLFSFLILSCSPSSKNTQRKNSLYLTSNNTKNTNIHRSTYILKSQTVVLRRITCGKLSEQDLFWPMGNERNRKVASEA